MKFLRLLLFATLGFLDVGKDLALADDRPVRMPPLEIKAAVSTKRALLIGVTKYDNYSSFALEGPVNDVALTRQTLIDMYGFPKENIASLSEAEGKPTLRPTRENIEREFAKLAKEAREGDQILILMAGHGSQQPESKNTKRPEQDGLDEIFLPADIQKWDDKTDRIPRAIIDDEISDWLEAITSRKAHVWAIFDCCHSGNITRGKETAREIGASTLIPAEVLRGVKVAAANREAKAKPPGLLNAKENSPYLVALFACASHETTPEGPQPEGKTDNPKYGLLSYTLNSILRTSAASGHPVTYAELTTRIQIKYAERMKYSPTPNIEGKGLDRFLFDMKEVKRPPFALLKQKENWIVNAGDLHGITAGSIFAVYPPAGEKDSNTVLGYVKATQSRPLDSLVAPTEHEGKKALEELLQGGRCEPAFINYGLRQLKVAITVQRDRDGKPVAEAAEMERAIFGAMEKEKEKGAVPFRVVKESEQPDVIIECFAKRAELIDASGLGSAVPVDLKAMDVTIKNLRRIHSARSLLAIAGRMQDQQSNLNIRATVDVDVEMIRIRKDKEEILKDENAMVFQAGDRAKFKITNRSRAKLINVALLIVRPNSETELYFPPNDEVGKALKPGESFMTRISGEFNNDPPFGTEQVIAIAIPATNPPVDFRKLTQPGLQDRDYDKYPLAALFDGKRNGLSSNEVRHQAMQIISYQLVPLPKK
jgi:hypothetical protein